MWQCLLVGSPDAQGTLCISSCKSGAEGSQAATLISTLVYEGADRTQAGASLPVSRLQRSLLKVLQFLHRRRSRVSACVGVRSDNDSSSYTHTERRTLLHACSTTC